MIQIFGPGHVRWRSARGCHTRVRQQAQLAVSTTVTALITALVFGVAGPTRLDAQTKTSTESPQPSADAADLINPDRPGIADGSRVIGPGQLQFEFGIQEERRRVDTGSRTTTVFVPTLIRFGISEHFEVRIESNSVTSTQITTNGSAVRRTAGYSPVSLGFKYGLYDSHSDSGGSGGSRRSLGMIARVFPSSGSSDFHTNRYTADARLAADWDFAPKLSLNPNVGVARYEDAQWHVFTAVLGALTLNYLPTERLNPFVDMGIQTPEESGGTTSIIVDTGIAYIVGQDAQLDVSIGRGVHGTTPPRPFVAVGFSIRCAKLTRR